MGLRSERQNGASPMKKSEQKRQKYRQKRKSTSIYFLLWAAFSAFTLLVLILFGLIQSVLLSQSYKGAVAKDVNQKGEQIVSDLTNNRLPVQSNWNMFVKGLSAHYGVNIVLLGEDGGVLLDSSEGSRDFSDEIVVLKEKLEERKQDSVTYQGTGEIVFGARLSATGQDAPTYVYVYKSLDMLETVLSEMRVRTGLLTIFTLVLAFAVSSAVSGWLTRPITDMTASARRLAEGDFDVDFHGEDYGSELAELAETLNFARDEISKTDTMQKEVIANVSHDFKTPLTMIKAYASMIKEISGNNPEKREKHAQVIIDEADRLTTLVGDVLDLSKLRSGIDGLQVEEVDMSATLSAILTRFSYLSESGYVFETDVEDDLFTRCDEVKMEQVLYNLIGNAVNYTGEDKRVRVALKRTGENVFRFSVTDTGVGISEEELSTIWDRYCRSATTHKRPVKGTGLGLSIVKAVLQRHGFAFGVDSRKGAGSTFWVDFPLA